MTPSRLHLSQLLVIMVTALAVRVAWVCMQPLGIDARTLPDQAEYLQLGRNLLTEKSLYFFDERFHQNVFAYRTPGYPVFVAINSGNVLLIRAAQALLDTTTVLAVYLLARRVLRDRIGDIGAARVGLLSAALVALNPFLIYFSGLILSETLFTSLLAWTLVLLTVAGPYALFGSSVLMGCAVLVRPSALCLTPMLAGVSVLLNTGRGIAYYRWTGLVRAGVASAVVMVMLLPWAYRNHQVLGKWIWTTTNGGVTLYDGFWPGATGASDQRFLQTEQVDEASVRDEVSRTSYYSAKARSAIVADPMRALRLAVVKVARMWSPVPLSSEYAGVKYWVVALAFSLPFDVLVIVGLCRSRMLTLPAKVLLTTGALYFTAIHAASVGSLRYRVPVEPPMAVIAACALARSSRATLPASDSVPAGS